MVNKNLFLKILFLVLCESANAETGLKADLSKKLYQWIKGSHCKDMVTEIKVGTTCSYGATKPAQQNSAALLEASEEPIFEELASAQLTANECLIKNLTNARVKSDLQAEILQIIGQKLPHLRQLRQLEKSLSHKLKIARIATFGVHDDATKRIANQSTDELKYQLKSVQIALEGIYADCWQGSHPQMREFIDKLANDESVKAPELFTNKTVRSSFDELIRDMSRKARETSAALLHMPQLKTQKAITFTSLTKTRFV